MSINLNLGDCLEAMKEMPDNSYDLAIVDPPYGINFAKAKGGSGWIVREGKDWDKEIPSEDYYNELYRVSSNQIIWGANYMTHYLKPSMGWIFWDKGQDLSMSDGELAYTSFQRPLRRIIINRGQLTVEGGTIHPTQKPIKLYEWLLTHYAKEGDKILDTHRGSGSLDIACHNLGYDLVTCEIDEQYFKDANERLRVHQSQLVMF